MSRSKRALGSLALALFAAGCGSRTGLAHDRPDAGARDAGTRDAGARDAGRDAATPLACPEPTGIGFTIAAHARHPIEGWSAQAPSAAGDGERALLALEVERGDLPRVALFALDLRGTPRELRELGNARAPELGAGEAELALATLDVTSAVIEVRGVGYDGADRWSARITAAGDARFTRLARPAFDGAGWVVAYAEADGVTVGTAGPAGFAAWRRLGGYAAALAADPDRRQSYLVVRTAPDAARLFRFDELGTVIGPADGVALPPIELPDAPAIAVERASGVLGALVLGSFLFDDVGLRVVLQRVRDDGTPTSGFSGPVGGMPSDVDLASHPALGGYGLYASATGRADFHGATRAFVGDLRSVTGASPQTVAIAPGPCGYFVLGVEHGDPPQLVTALAVPRR
ncbi:MAG: hypothetical protein KF729_12095 [Sandaracinaceae bacterium]|nr:hypothetical protein [Sandaracinaceae bacterium]